METVYVMLILKNLLIFIKNNNYVTLTAVRPQQDLVE